MKPLFLAFVFLAALAEPNSPGETGKRAAQAAFNKLVAYQKTDDERTLDLHSPDCRVEFTYENGARKNNVGVPIEDFLAKLKAMIAKKSGTTDTYSKIAITEKDGVFEVNSLRHSKKSGRDLPFSVSFKEDKDGELKIIRLQLTLWDGA